MRRIISLLLSLFFFNLLFAQSNNDTNITGDDAGWGDRYDLIYKVDGVLYKTITLEEGAIITPEPSPTKEGYTFSDWSEIPSKMPAHDVEVTGSFIVNKYLLTVIIDDVIIYSDSVSFGTRLAEYIEIITEIGIDLTQWEWYDQIDNITMPAYDVIINTVSSIVVPLKTNSKEPEIYDLRGKRIVTSDVSILPPGIYIRDGHKFIIR